MLFRSNRGLVDAADDDIIMVSDLDELIRPQVVDQMRRDDDISVWGLRMPLFNFKFNYMLTSRDSYNVWGMATRKKFMIPADQLRRQRFELFGFPFGYCADGVKLVEHAGWQFTYLGNNEFAVNKIRSFAHTETNIPEVVDNLDVDRSILNGDGIYHHPDYRFSPVRLDEYFPKSLVLQQDKYANYILERSEEHTSELQSH